MRMRGAVIALAATLAFAGDRTSGESLDPCALLAPDEVAVVLGRPAAGRATMGDLAITCEYETVGDEDERAVLAFDLFRSDSLGLTGSAESYYHTVREGSWHLLWRASADRPVEVAPVEDVGDDAFCVNGVLHLVDGSDTYLAIEVSGRVAGRVLEPTCGTDDASALAPARVAGKLLLRSLSRQGSAPGGGADSGSTEGGAAPGGGADCEEVDCFRALVCVETCGGPVIQASCCPCPEGTFDSIECDDR